MLADLVQSSDSNKKRGLRDSACMVRSSRRSAPSRQRRNPHPQQWNISHYLGIGLLKVCSTQASIAGLGLRRFPGNLPERKWPARVIVPSQKLLRLLRLRTDSGPRCLEERVLRTGSGLRNPQRENKLLPSRRATYCQGPSTTRPRTGRSGPLETGRCGTHGGGRLFDRCGRHLRLC